MVLFSFLAFIGASFFLFFCYLVINQRITNTVEKRFQQYYHKQLKADIQEFYSEMETYATIFENRIHKFKLLVQQQETNIQKWSDILNNIKVSKKVKETLANIHNDIDSKIKSEEASIKFYTNQLTKNPLIKSTNLKPEKTTIIHNNIQQSLPIIEEESLSTISPAEEALNSILSGELQKKVTYPIKKESLFQADTEEVSSNNTSEIINFLAKVGRSVGGKLATPTVKNININPPQEEDNFSKLLEKRSSDIIEKIVVKQDVVTVSEDAILRNASTHKADNTSIKLSSDEIAFFLDDLSDPKKRPNALKALLNQGFSLQDLSDMANIPYSSLQMAQKIYGLHI